MTLVARTPSHLVFALVGIIYALPAAAEDFYAGKQINFIVGAGVGGGYDHQARLVARHLGRHVPGNPGIIVQNMPAAGSMAATNYMFGTAPKDGTTIALVQRGMLLAKLTYPSGTRFRDRQIPLVDQPQQRDRCDAGMECDIGAQNREGPV